MSLSLAALADLAEEEGRGIVELCAPRVRFRSVGLSDLDACLDWFAELVMAVDIDDVDDVVVGSLDFTVIRLGTADPIALCLDQFDGDHEMLAGLFDGNQLAERVEEQFETLSVVTEAVLIPNIAFVTEARKNSLHRLWPCTRATAPTAERARRAGHLGTPSTCCRIWRRRTTTSV